MEAQQDPDVEPLDLARLAQRTAEYLADVDADPVLAGKLSACRGLGVTCSRHAYAQRTAQKHLPFLAANCHQVEPNETLLRYLQALK